MKFRYSEREAEITARFEVGTRNLAVPAACAALIIVACVQAIRLIFQVYIPLHFLIAQACAAAVAVIAA